MNKKIVFIVNAIGTQRCIKRIDEFAERGYYVEAFGFDRGLQSNKQPKRCEIKEIGCINNSTGYLKRLKTIYYGVNYVLKKTRNEEVLYYVFGLDNAMFFMLQSSKKFIYEESDLVHTYMKSKLAISFFEWIDKRAIKKSLLSVFTSEGFIRYHFGDNRPENTHVIANRLPLTVNNLEKRSKKPLDIDHLSIGFVGYLRFNTIANFCKVFCEHYPEHNFHFFGVTNNEPDRLLFEPLKKYSTCHFHGPFKHPNDLPEVYSQIDLVLSTYDVENENVRYAEPNKIYEAIYFKTPIVVSSGTFLAEKVEELGIGYAIDAMDENEIVNFVNSLTEKSIMEKVENIRKIDTRKSLNINDGFFEKLENMLNLVRF